MPQQPPMRATLHVTRGKSADWILPTSARFWGGGAHPLAWLDESQSSGMMLGDDVSRDGRKRQKEAKGEDVSGDIGRDPAVYPS